MTFEQAQKKLKRMVGRRYSSVKYERTMGYYDKESWVTQECVLYVEDLGISAGRTWAWAFKILGRKLKSDTPIEPGPVAEVMP